MLRTISLITASGAFATAILVIALRLIHLARPNLFPWTFRSAIPLILVGVAFACLQFAVPRSQRKMALGLLVSAAFIGWGMEQFLPNPQMAACVDDFVVFAFVLDLGLVIYGHLTH